LTKFRGGEKSSSLDQGGKEGSFKCCGGRLGKKGNKLRGGKKGGRESETR